MRHISTSITAAVAAIALLQASASATVEDTAKATRVEFHVENATILDVVAQMNAMAAAQGVTLDIRYEPPLGVFWRTTRVTIDLKKSNLWDVARYVAGLTNSKVRVDLERLVID